MKYDPHDYQKYAIEFIKNNKVAAILLSCGLGKTSITLTAINDLMFDSFEVNKVLVIAPLRVAKLSWPDELKKWEHLKNIRYQVVVGTLDERKRALNAKADVYIINRENVQWLIERSGFEFDFDMVVIDELSSFKNHNSKRFKALLKVRPLIKRIVGLTGTPCSNGLMDLWAQYRLLDMGKRLGRFISNYREEYFKPGASNGNVVFNYIPLLKSENKIYEKVSDITISMKSVDHLKMPDLFLNTYRVYLDENLEDDYKEFKKTLVLEYGAKEITAANAAVLTGKLLQFANGAVYDDSKEVTFFHDKKIEALEDIIESLNGKPLLVSYSYKHDRDRIVNRLKTLNVTYDDIKSDESIRKWNKKQIQVGLVHPASAGHGLNLQEGGSTLVWFGLPWSLELYQQTNARLYRQGQKDAVVILHIVTHGTVDEIVMKALSAKEKVQDKLIEAVKAEIEGGLLNGKT